jgi:thiamine-phosphate pyrophosphorylase
MEAGVPDPFALDRSLFVITDPDKEHNDVVSHLRSGVRGGATHLMIRRPGAPAAELYDLACTLCSGLRGDATWQVLVHERVDVALAAHAQGAHLNRGGIPFGPAKILLGERRMLGVSVHDAEQAVAAALQKADYVLFGHVYETSSHPGEPGRGLQALREVVEAATIPVIAIGGITPERVDDVLAAGASGVAVIRAVSDAGDPERATRELRMALDDADYPHLSPQRRTHEAHRQ